MKNKGPMSINDIDDDIYDRMFKDSEPTPFVKLNRSSSKNEKV